MASPELSLDRGMPASPDAERSLLGAVILDNDLANEAMSSLRAEHFYLDAHRKIYGRMMDLSENGRPIDIITLAEELGRNKELESVGGVAYLSSLTDGVPRRSSIEHYVKIVSDKATLRSLIHAANGVIAQALEATDEASEVLNAAEAAIFRISDQRGTQELMTVAEIAQESFGGNIEKLYSRGQRITGLETYYADLDERTSGLQPSDLIIIAARPSMGKAQPLDAKVRTPSGWKAMGELKVGDELASVDGRPSVLTGIFPQGRRKVWRVRFSDGRSTECCDEHLWRVHYRSWDTPRVLNTARVRELLERKRYQNRIWIERATGDFGHNDPLPVDPWVLGCLLGDGNLTGTGSVRFSTAATQIVKAMAARAGAGMMVTPAGGYDYRIVRVDKGKVTGEQGAQPNPLRTALEALGLSGLSSERKFIPRLYLTASRERRLELLRGLLDTDGWVERWGSVRLSTSSRQLAEDVAELVRSLGGWCSITTKQPHFRNTKGLRVKGLPAYVCHISYAEPKSLFLLPEKKARAPRRWKREKRLTFASIEPSRTVPTQCISVSHPTRLYITDKDIVTHNTAFAINIAENVAVEGGKTVAVFSLEMSREALLNRMLCSQSKVDSHKMRTGFIGKDDQVKLRDALAKLLQAPIYIDDTAGISLTELRSKARRLKQTIGLDLIVIDYLQLMSASAPGGKRYENRTQEVSAISRGLKAIAKELKVPVIALSQLSRGPESRGGSEAEPKLSDLRESGAIEQDADVVMFLYRPEYYDRNNPELEGKAKVIIAKQRNGPTDTIQLAFLKASTRFETLDRSMWLHD